MEMKGSNQSLVKTTNQLLIIKEIRQNGQLSRSELAKRLKLSNPSVSKNVDDLISKGLIVETGSVVTDVGRRPIMLQFNGKHGCVAVIDLSSDDGRICIADLLGNKLKYSRIEGGKVFTVEILEGMIDTLRAMLSDIGNKCGKLIGICIGAPGVVDPSTGRIQWSSRFENFRELDLEYMFGKAFGVPVTVKNDVNLAVCGERIFGCGNGADSMIYINVDAGVGVGIVIDGKLYEGRRGFAGDLGVLLVDCEKALKASKDTGGYMDMILENVLSIYSITNDVKAMFSGGKQTVLRTYVSSVDEITFSDIVKAYGMGDEQVTLVVDKYAKVLAILLKNLASLFDVELLVLGGQITKLGSSFTNVIMDSFLTFPGYSMADIRISRLLDTAVIFGGIDTATQNAIERIIDGE